MKKVYSTLAVSLIIFIMLLVFSGCEKTTQVEWGNDNAQQGTNAGQEGQVQDNGQDNVDEIFDDKDVQPPVIPTG